MVNFVSYKFYLSKKKCRGRGGFRYSLIFLERGLGLLFPLLCQTSSLMARSQLLPCPILCPPTSFLFPQFLCLKNIRTFLSTCYEKFGLKRSELFEAFDLFDVQDFGKVRWD